MGCFPSRRAAKKRSRLEAERAAAAAEAERRAAADARAADQLPRPTPLPRPLSRVEAQAGMYEALDAQSRQSPKLQHVNKVNVGQKSQKLLDGYEKIEADARAIPVLVSVEKKDLKAGDGFNKMLGEYELKDAKAAAEPKLEKTFVQRERESVARVMAMQSATDMRVQVPSIY